MRRALPVESGTGETRSEFVLNPRVYLLGFFRGGNWNQEGECIESIVERRAARSGQTRAKLRLGLSLSGQCQ